MGFWRRREGFIPSFLGSFVVALFLFGAVGWGWKLSSFENRRRYFESCDLGPTKGLLPTTHELQRCSSNDEDDRNLYFFHIFKSGGTSVALMMDAWCNSSVQLSVWPNHKRVSDFSFPDGGYIFTFVRDPVSRFLSAYHEVKKREKEGLEERQRKRQKIKKQKEDREKMEEERRRKRERGDWNLEDEAEEDRERAYTKMTKIEKLRSDKARRDLMRRGREEEAKERDEIEDERERRKERAKERDRFRRMMLKEREESGVWEGLLGRALLSVENGVGRRKNYSDVSGDRGGGVVGTGRRLLNARGPRDKKEREWVAQQSHRREKRLKERERRLKEAGEGKERGQEKGVPMVGEPDTPEKKMIAFRKTLSDVEKRFFDPHFQPQVAFLLQKRKQIRSRIDFIGMVDDIDTFVPGFLKEMHGVSVDPAKLVSPKLEARSRDDPAYRLEPFVIKREDLSEEDIERIQELYRYDYSCFNLPRPVSHKKEEEE